MLPHSSHLIRTLARYCAFALGLGLTLSACNSYQSKVGSTDLHIDSATLANPSYKAVDQYVIARNCMPCHASPQNKGHLNLETYANILAAKDKIEIRVLVDGTMPPPSRPPMSPSELQLLKNWLNVGAPQDASTQPIVGPQPTPPNYPPAGPPSGAEPNFKSIYDKIFEKHCNECHGTPGEDAYDVLQLDDKNALFGSEKKYIVPGDPAGSLLFTAINRPGKGRMPPRRNPGLAPEDIETIRLWIANGAKD
jgi:uncharacterized membrane protein